MHISEANNHLSFGMGGGEKFMIGIMLAAIGWLSMMIILAALSRELGITSCYECCAFCRTVKCNLSCCIELFKKK